jgi:hypothetical protein
VSLHCARSPQACSPDLSEITLEVFDSPHCRRENPTRLEPFERLGENHRLLTRKNSLMIYGG